MPKLTINDRQIDVADGTNLVAAAEQAGLEIPHYCYHAGLSVAGNCRMCLVDIKALSEKQPNPLPKLQIACNTVALEGMVVETDNDKVKEARKGVLEFLLINHPIDCPICDQAGECKLQEYYMDYGAYQSRFPLREKVSKGKAIPVGPSIMLDQERCILCTRCVRFLDEVTDTHELNVKERGDHSELSLADGKAVDNPYATNIVDICPVGALTSREFRFQARVWYLQGEPSVCSGCSTGCNVDVHSRRDQIYRLKPRANHNVNGFWMCDEGRRTYQEGQSDQRLVASASRRDEAFVELSWDDAAARSAGILNRAESISIVASPGISIEEAFLLTEISSRIAGGELLTLGSASSAIADDGLLISSDRFANRAGLRALGFADADGRQPSNSTILVYRCDPASEPTTDTSADTETSAWVTALENAASVIHATEFGNRTCEFADEVLAVGSHYEIPGSYLNRDERLQAAAATVQPPRGAVPGWRMLAAVLTELGGTEYREIDAVFAAAASSLGLGEGRTHADLGGGGMLLEDLRSSAVQGGIATPTGTPETVSVPA